MDISEGLISAGIAVVSSAATGIVFVWKTSRYLKGIEDKLIEFEKSAKKHEEADDERHEKLQKEFDESSKNSEESWRELNRSLGQIEGALGVGETPPPRRRAKSFPGAE